MVASVTVRVDVPAPLILPEILTRSPCAPVPSPIVRIDNV